MPGATLITKLNHEQLWNGKRWVPGVLRVARGPDDGAHGYALRAFYVESA